MLNKPAEGFEGLSAAPVRAAVYILLVCGALEMVVQSGQRCEHSVAEIAFIAITIISSISCPHINALVARELDHRYRDDVLTVPPPHNVIDLLTIET